MYKEEQKNIIRQNELKDLRKLKVKENQKKDFSNLKDVLNTSDFIFEKYGKRKGDSGQLFLATNKNDKDEMYLIKHEHFDCAYNEYMYSKIANAMNINVAKVYLFKNDNENNIFKSDYICGVKFYKNKKDINYSYIMENKKKIKNWQDFYKFKGLETLLFEGDDIEIILNKNKIYRIDTTDSMQIDEYSLHRLAYFFESSFINTYEITCKDIMRRVTEFDHWKKYWKYQKEAFIESYGKDYLQYYLEPFYKIKDINDKDIKEWTKTLCYFYPDIMGEYYEKLIQNLQLETREFLKENYLISTD